MEKMTKYERTLLIGTRALQLESGEMPVTPFDEGDSIIKIAERDVASGLLGLRLHRRTSNGDYTVMAVAKNFECYHSDKEDEGESAAPPQQKAQCAAVGHCRGCATGEHTRTVRIPYAMKLLMQETQACHQVIRLRMDDEGASTHGEFVEPVTRMWLT